MEKKLSIAIPTFGYPVSVVENIQRLLKFDRNDIEIVLVDNDASGKQIKDYMMSIEDERLHYYQNECNIGRSNNMIRAIEKADSNYVLLMSSDDELFPNAVDEIMDIISNSPDFALIMGTIRTNLGNTAFSKIESGRYQKGYEALNILPFLGNLIPFVINKSYIHTPDFYDLDETYMQNRLVLSVANSGDLFFLKQDLGRQIDNMSDRYSDTMPEIFANNEDLSSWNTKGCYYAPQSRIIQLQSELEIINQYTMRGDQKIKIVDKLVSRRIGQLCEYLVGCHDPYLIHSSGTAGFMSYQKVFQMFLEQMEQYFQKIEADKLYFFSGRVRDIVNNELLLIEQAENILKQIAQSQVYIWDVGNQSGKLLGMLSLMNIEMKGLIVTEEKSREYCKDAPIVKPENLSGTELILIPGLWNDFIIRKLQAQNIKNYHFMDRMSKYLAVVWCSSLQTEESIKEYLNYY